MDGETETPQGKITWPSSPSRPAAKLGTTIQVLLVLNFPPSQINQMTLLSFVMNNPFIVNNEWSITTTQIYYFDL